MALLGSIRKTPRWQAHYPAAAPELEEFIWDLEEDSLLGWVRICREFPDDPTVRLVREAYEAPCRIEGKAAPGIEVIGIIHLDRTFQAVTARKLPTTDPDWRPDLPNLPRRLTRAETLSVVLPIIWADSRLWGIIRSVEDRSRPESDIDEYLADTYQVRLKLPLAAWNQLIQFPRHRDYVFLLIPSVPGRFCEPPGRSVAAESRESAAAIDAASKALAAYFGPEMSDPLPGLAKANLPTVALKAIRAACDKLRDDAAWCLKHPGMMPAPRATLTRPPAKRILRAEALERMVDILRAEPDLADYDLAKRALGDPGSTGRTQARDAKILANLRDRISVAQYKTRGRRRGRGDGA